MAISVFDLFSIGIGPSSSHTVGPMIAAHRFVRMLTEQSLLPQVSRIQVELFGSLSATGKGHATDQAVIGGLLGFLPEDCDPQALQTAVAEVRQSRKASLHSIHTVDFSEREDLVFSTTTLPFHSNGLRFTASDNAGKSIGSKVYYSVGGGFVIDDSTPDKVRIVPDRTSLPFPFSKGDELLKICQETQLSISSVMLSNEIQWHDEVSIHRKLHIIWNVMQECIQAGCESPGVLPGGMKVKRRAPALYQSLQEENSTAETPGPADAMQQLDFVNLWAIAVNEENAAGGRVVTAPTNGAAGIIPAVLKYAQEYCVPKLKAEQKKNFASRFLLTAAAVGIIFKENASISGAEVGCQGEVGSACSMAAAGLTEILGGSVQQVENAAEIAMEHNLGLTCDPVGGLVQVPCIERNAMASVKAINASRLALRGDGYHYVSLDKVVKTMRDTGRDMQTKYKETARGGLAVNVIEC